MARTFRTYLFGLLVVCWQLGAAGIPVYFHYCEGELEDVTVYVQSNGCCEGEQNDTSGPDDCCSNEDVYLVNSADCLQESQHVLQAIKLLGQTVWLPCNVPVIYHLPIAGNSPYKFPPTAIYKASLISTSVLRI